MPISRSKRKKNKRHSPPAANTPNAKLPAKAKGNSLPHLLKKVPRIVWETFAALTVFFGVYATYVEVFSSRISVDPAETIDPANSYSTPFIISNDGFISLNDVDVSYKINKIENAKGGGLRGFTISNPLKHVNLLRPTEKMTYSVPVDYGLFSTTVADIEILVSFRPDYAMWRKSNPYRFQATKAPNGQLRWLPSPSKN